MIVSNTCVNRVAKVFKVVLDGNDLAQLDAGPIDLIPIVEGNKFKCIFSVSLFNSRENDYKGTLNICYNSNSISFVNSWILDSSDPSLSLSFSHDFNGCLQVRKGSEFEIGLVRGPIELHFYYFEEKVSIPFVYGYEFQE